MGRALGTELDINEQLSWWMLKGKAFEAVYVVFPVVVELVEGTTGEEPD